eukprot:415534-Amphidinium_carterae.1
MSLGWGPPAGNEWCSAYIDDLGLVHIVASDVPEFLECESLSRVEEAEAKANQAYQRSGFMWQGLCA